MGESLSTLWKETKEFLWNYRYYIGTGLITAGFCYYFSHKYENVSCTKFLDKLDAGEITKVIISGGILQFPQFQFPKASAALTLFLLMNSRMSISVIIHRHRCNVLFNEFSSTLKLKGNKRGQRRLCLLCLFKMQSLKKENISQVKPPCCNVNKGNGIIPIIVKLLCYLSQLP